MDRCNVHDNLAVYGCAIAFFARSRAIFDTPAIACVLFPNPVFFEQDFFGLVVLVQIVIELLFQKITDEFVDGRSVGSHVARAEFGFGLRLEYGFFHLDADSRHHAVANVGIFEVFGVKFFDGTRDGFFECRESVPPSMVCCPLTNE